MKETLRSAAWLLRMSWTQNRLKTGIALVLILSNALAAPLMALSMKWLTNAALAGDTTGAEIAGFAVAACVIGVLTLGHFAHMAYFELSEMNQLDAEERIIALANGSAGIEHQERADVADKLAVLEQEIQQIQAGFYAVLALSSLAVAIGLTGILLALVNPVLLLLPLVALPPLFAGRRAQLIIDKSRDETAQDTRLAMHLFRLATGAGPAKELRVFRLQTEIKRRHAELWERTTRTLWRAQIKATAYRAAGQLVFAGGYVAGVMIVVNDAIGGHRSIGDVVLAITLAAQVNQQISAAVSLLHDLQRIARAYARFEWLEKYVAEREPTQADHPVPERLNDGIHFNDVAFKYPGTDRVVLAGVNLHLPAGSTVAIVGENGAGKSTLVKLLCRFYEPTAGTITADGSDMARIPLDKWRERIATGFQDFARFEFVARQTVGVGDLPFVDDQTAVEGALERAHATDVIERLKLGLSTQLGKSYTEGTELSGGQWQKLALGRAMMRELPLVLILDEPTSALDAEAEHNLFERYAEGARRVGAATGGITVLVSHRFSTVRMADQIVVVADGKVAEAGSHQQLMKNRGLYAELYELQASAYE
ncbi:MAG TPA: ABC transporter ATP-binding protein [Candidatus Limnocylindrales bacterium]